MNESLTVFKALSDDTRLKIVRALREKEMYVELLAERLHLAPATVSFHMKKLLGAGLVEQRREQYYTMYILKEEVLNIPIGKLIEQGEGAQGQEELREAQYRAKVLRAFMPYGTCETLPAQIKKRMIVFEEIIAQFENGKSYPEKDVNEIISRIHADYCTVRRAFIGLDWMRRENGVYTVTYPPKCPAKECAVDET